ncbi:phospholipid carrier-dependent glycosyltransferase [Microbacterium thalassium]|uniref:4-amino-4-deoxy-L-arabinose transferase-like glycosyltransferase n=1 Tax=Microbacterium thalassium TaxID=362649 RepID=A0A7X0FP73_9MICO|nr:phospholipid carrier-dependent glycosyltransferase [Microbacterium thalassium]MBB6391034.1 4-amino-4-deoxy-L-arabinose transferase-like glycosyltransferase [Microbacterium thalassium]GLK24794.1 hypothetical protein GCM10017607_21120 [Microbacterium thalassium]
MQWAARAGTLAATALLAGALVAWAVVAPGYRGPDEPQHVSAVIDLALESAYPPPGTAPLDPGVRGSYPWFGFAGATDYSGIDVTVGALPNDAPSLNELRELSPEADAGLRNQITQHPPLYYLYLAGVVHLLSLADAPITTAVLVLRLASALLLLPIPWLIVVTAYRLRLSPSAAFIAAMIPAAWVQFVHIGAVVGNGTMLALTTSAAVALLIRVVTGDLTVRTSVGLGFALSAALLSKGFALPLLPLAVFAYLWRWRTDRARIWKPMLIGAAVSLIGCSWYVASFLRFGTLQPMSRSVEFEFSASALLEWIPRFLTALSSSMWMNLGWLETPPQPPILHLAVSATVGVLVILGTWAMRRLPGALVVLHGSWALPLLIFGYGSARSWLYAGTIRAAQGRYLQLAVIAVAVLIVASIQWSRWMVSAAPALCTVAIVFGVIFGIRHFWATPTLASVAGAWPGGTAAFVTAGALLVAGSAVGTFVALRIPTRAQEDAAEPASI